MAHTFNICSALLAGLLLISAVTAYEQINVKKEYDAYLELYSQFPVFHVYHNRHFSRSRQFPDFLEVLEDTELKARDFAKFLLTDCEKVKKDQFDTCEAMARNNENRAIHGLAPSDQLLTMGDKKLQRAPAYKTFRHPSDVYSVDEIMDFIDGLMPAFVTRVSTKEDLKEFLQPRYSPKLLYFTKEEWVPKNIGKLSVHFNLRIDFAYIEDLSEDLVMMYNITKFPTLVVLTYNYNNRAFNSHTYDGPQFDTNGYYRMKDFLGKFALQEPRVDLMFHSIKRPVRNDIVVLDNQQDLWRELDKAPGWTVIEYGHVAEKLPSYEKKNGLFLSYIHYQTPKGSTPRIENYLPRLNQSIRIPETNEPGELPLQTIDAEHALSNISGLISEDYTVMIVRQKYGYLCPITEQTFFRGLVFCLVLDENDYEKFKQRIGKDMEIGLVCSQGNTPGQFSGQPLDSINYEKLYMLLEFNVKTKLNAMMRDYFSNPIKEFKEVKSIALLCRDPQRKCVIAFLSSHKPQTMKVELQYLKDVASDYFTEFKFFWVEDSCNTELKLALSEPRMTMMVYDPRNEAYSPLRNRISKTIVSKFLNKARRNDLQFKPFGDPFFNINSCRQAAEEIRAKQAETASPASPEQIVEL